jgi:hypothetical protein
LFSLYLYELYEGKIGEGRKVGRSDGVEAPSSDELLVPVALYTEALKEVRANVSQLGIPSVTRAITGHSEELRNR